MRTPQQPKWQRARVRLWEHAHPTVMQFDGKLIWVENQKPESVTRMNPFTGKKGSCMSMWSNVIDPIYPTKILGFHIECLELLSQFADQVNMVSVEELLTIEDT